MAGCHVAIFVICHLKYDDVVQRERGETRQTQSNQNPSLPPGLPFPEGADTKER